MAPGGLANQLVEEYSPGNPASGASFDVYTDFMATCDIKQQSNPSCQTDQTAGADQRVQVPTSPPGNISLKFHDRSLFSSSPSLF